MMIIYHFKQRIGILEKKTETTVEILNNLAKEMNVLRGFVFNMNSIGSNGLSPFFSVSSSDESDEEREVVNNITIDLNDNIQIEHLDISEQEEESNRMIIQNSEIDSDEEESDEGEETDNDTDDDDINVNEIVSNNIERVVVSDNESETVPEPEQIIEEISIVAADEIVQPEDYSKLTTSQLKNIVSDKKIHSGNVNKLKRNELLQLLQ